MSADGSAVVALLLALGAGAPAAAAPQGGALPPPPVCVGPDRALQWDGAGWRCATISGARCTEWTLCATGHFAALEQPEALAEEVRAFFRPLRGSPR